MLDLAPVPAGSTAAQALANSVELAQHVERLGYTRHWVAEHHNMAGIASSSPPVLIAHLAVRHDDAAHRRRRRDAPQPRRRSRWPNSSARWKRSTPAASISASVAPRAPTRSPPPLSGATPGRPATSSRRSSRDLLDYFAGTHPQIIAATAAGNRPEMWLLGSSDYSAHAAGLLGLPFSFAHHFASAGTAQALQTYRESFRPSQLLEQPYSMIGVPVICAADERRRTYLSGPSALSFLNLRQGRPIQMCSPEEAAQHEFTPMEREIVRGWHGPLVMGDPQQVRTQLDDLVDRFGVDELMLTTMVYDQADRLRSYELVAEAWNLAPAAGRVTISLGAIRRSDRPARRSPTARRNRRRSPFWLAGTMSGGTTTPSSTRRSSTSWAMLATWTPSTRITSPVTRPRAPDRPWDVSVEPVPLAGVGRAVEPHRMVEARPLETVPVGDVAGGLRVG